MGGRAEARASSNCRRRGEQRRLAHVRAAAQAAKSSSVTRAAVARPGVVNRQRRRKWAVGASNGSNWERKSR